MIFSRRTETTSRLLCSPVVEVEPGWLPLPHEGLLSVRMWFSAVEAALGAISAESTYRCRWPAQCPPL